jgi:hypothetical protein
MLSVVGPHREMIGLPAAVDVATPGSEAPRARPHLSIRTGARAPTLITRYLRDRENGKNLCVRGDCLSSDSITPLFT